MNATMMTQDMQMLRSRIQSALSAVSVPESTPGAEPPVQRADGVLEFYKHWLVRGEGPASGLFAMYSDCDDVVEFGLTERDGENVTNVLQASIVLDGGELNVVSEARSDLNFDAIVTPEKAQQLDEALRFFVAVFHGN
jgi:hypothetical protein